MTIIRIISRMDTEKIAVVENKKEYKTSDAVRRALNNYRLKNATDLNVKNLVNYHENMKNEDFVEKRRAYDRNRKTIIIVYMVRSNHIYIYNNK